MKSESTTKRATVETITAGETNESRGKALLLDVRTPAEFEEAHIDGAVLHPLGGLNPEAVRKLSAENEHCVVICRSGNRARQAANKLADAGVESISVLDGGVQAWEAAGLPLIRGQKTMSLERQVRIAAGTLVFTGAVLGYFVNPAWIALSGFVGAGLVFAGVTDTCAMGMMIARLPWNNRSHSTSASSGSCCAK